MKSLSLIFFFFLKWCNSSLRTYRLSESNHQIPWNSRILFVNFSAQSSLFTSNVGYKSCSLSKSSQLLSLSKVSHWWSGVISASQFKQFPTVGFSGVKTSGAGEGKSSVQGKTGVRSFLGKGELLSTSFSGDSTSLLSPIWISDLILWAKGERFEGESRVAGLFLAFSVLTETASWRWTHACAAWRR